MELCKYCMVCIKPCGDDCKDYVPNKDFEYLELKWEIEDNNPNEYKDELTAKEKILASFTTEELETELKRRIKLNTNKAVDFFSVHSREEVEEIDKRIEREQKEYDAKLRDRMRKAKDFPMTN